MFELEFQPMRTPRPPSNPEIEITMGCDLIAPEMDIEYFKKRPW